MAISELVFGPSARPAENGTHRVYFRESWADDWTELTAAHCLEATHSIQPAMSSAVVEWFYGVNLDPGEAAYSTRLKSAAIAKARWYVKIEFDCQPDGQGGWDTRTWYGIVEDAEDQQAGRYVRGDDTIVHGRVRLICYGLEKLLNDQLIDHSVVNSLVGEVACSLDFNLIDGRRGPVPNMSSVINADGVYEFENQAGQPNKGDYWSSKKIVDYLLKYHGPVDELGLQKIAFVLDADAGAPPDWDRPQLYARGGITTGALLNQIIDRRRLMTWHVRVVDDQPTVVVRTMAKQAVPLNLPGAAPLPANSEQLNIRHETDQLTSVAVKDSNLPVVDQVVVRGPEQRHVGTFSILAGNLQKGWSASQESAYETGASGTAGYGAAGTKERQRRNAIARGRAELDQVFSRFEIPPTWDFMAGHAIGGAAQSLMFPDLFGAVDKQPWSNLFVEQTMPLLVGVDYSGNKIGQGTVDLTDSSDGREQRPLVLLWRPDDGSGGTSSSPDRWTRAEDIGRMAAIERSSDDKTNTTAVQQNDRFSVSVQVPPAGHAIEVRVVGEVGQHAIAATDFTALADDERLGGWDYTGSKPMIVTLSMRSCRHVEARWPQNPAARDAIREKLILAGDEYTRDYVTPGTVVDVAADGSFVTSDGGWIPADGPSSNLARLEAIARVSAEWYTATHKVATLSTYDLRGSDDIRLGQLVRTIGGTTAAPASGHAEEVNAIVSQITIQTPRGSSGSAPAEARMHVVTWAGELDPSTQGPPLQVQQRKQPVPPSPDSSMLQRLQSGQQEMAPGFTSPEEAAFFHNNIELRNAIMGFGEGE